MKSLRYSFVNQIALLILLFSGISTAQTTDNTSIPEDFFGSYKGTLEITGANAQSVAMEFHLKQTDSVGVFEYTLIYGEGPQKDERLYTLKEKGPNMFVLDENNGILLDVVLAGRSFHSFFEVQGSLLHTILTFENDQMIWKAIFGSTGAKRISESDPPESVEVFSYPIKGVQEAILNKQ